MFSKETIKLLGFVSLVTLFTGLFLSSTDFIHTPVNRISDFITIAGHWFVVLIGIWGLFYILSINKYVFAVTFPLINIISAILAYFRYTINAVLTTMLVDASLNNDMQTSADLITPGLIIFILFILLISIIFVIYRFKKIIIRRPFIQLGFALLFFGVFMQIPRFKRPVSERIPFNIYFVTKNYYHEKEIISADRPGLSDGIICPSADDSLTVIFIIGESLRADHLGINGYHRNTTPLLGKEDVISFTNIYSEQSYTNASIPHLLTRADSLHKERAFKERSFIDLFNSCGFYSSWLANQESADTYVYFMHECNHLKYVNIEKSYYVFDQWLDESLLPLLDKELSTVHSGNKKLIILHTIGSHWYYNSHYTSDFEVFTPIISSRIISSSKPEELINSYDNTVLYTDFFIHSVIDRLQNKNAVVLYLSDHGESLGENGVWLHAADSPPVHEPACLVWMSSKYKEHNLEKYNNAQKNRNNHYRTDFLFHSILDAANIGSPYLETQLSIFR